MHNKKYILMSIKPVFAELIKSGQKTIELRRTAPKIKPGDILIIYESSPVKRITSYCEIDSIIVTKLDELWKEAKHTAGLTYSSYSSYFNGKDFGVGIRIGKVHILDNEKKLSALSPELMTPQSYRYLSEELFQTLTK